jgi:hypothetical protein
MKLSPLSLSCRPRTFALIVAALLGALALASSLGSLPKNEPDLRASPKPKPAFRFTVLLRVACALLALLLVTGCAGFGTTLVLEHEKYGQLTYRLADPYGLKK